VDTVGDPLLCVPESLFRHRQSNSVAGGSPGRYYLLMSYVRYRCEFCGHEVVPNQSGTMKLVLAWVRDNNTGIRGAKNQHKYAHAVCVETETGRKKKEGSSGEMLF
jgi:hypothetical protein